MRNCAISPRPPARTRRRRSLRRDGHRSIPPRSPPRCRNTTPRPSTSRSAGSRRSCRPLELLRDVLMPVLAQVGDDWHRGPARIAHEHLMSSTMRNILGSFLRLYARPDASTRLLFATLAGERHEIGTLGAAMLAASSGLGVAYLGPDLPAREIVESVRPAGAQVLVLGLTDDLGGQGDGARTSHDRPRSPEGRRAVGGRTRRRASRLDSSARGDWSFPTTTPTNRSSSASADAWRDAHDMSRPFVPSALTRVSCARRRRADPRRHVCGCTGHHRRAAPSAAWW